jgi:hypothetical protein
VCQLSRLRINTVILVALTGLFVFAQYNLARLTVTPFGLDPCDAVSHFAIFAVALGLFGSLRALRSYHERIAHSAREVYILRSQQAVALAVLITFSAHVVALARHPSMWMGADWRNQLLGWLAVFGAIAIAMELLILRTRSIRAQGESSRSQQAKLASLLALTVLVFCPEYGLAINSETAHILTVTLGALVVLVPMGYLLPVLVPHQSGDEDGSKPFFKTGSERRALIGGILLGAFLFWIDAYRTGPARALLPILKFMGPVMGLLVAYAFLARELGWSRE